MRFFLLVIVFLMVPTFSQAREGYQFSLNGKDISTNPAYLSGPYGCQSDLYNTETQRYVCPLDGVVSPESVFKRVIAQTCPLTMYGQSVCVGGFVGVGTECPRYPARCTYYRITNTYDMNERYTVPINRIYLLGPHLWIEKPQVGLWKLFSHCHSAQFAPNRNPNEC